MKGFVKNAALLAAVVLFFIPVHAAPRNPVPKKPAEILVEYKAEMTQRDISEFAQKHGVEPLSMARAAGLLEKYYSLSKIQASIENTPYTRYSVAAGTDLDAIVAGLKSESVVAAAQPNYYRYALAYAPMAQPNDPIYQKTATPVPAVDIWGVSLPSQWGLAMINADDAYNAGLINQFPARQVIVAVLDTGIKTDHPDLTGMTITGRNILNPAAAPFDDELDGGHGTHVAGIIAANTHNGAGIAGTAYCNTSWTAKILLMPVKILDEFGEGNDADTDAGIRWAADNGANVINISLGGPQQSEVLQKAVNYAYGKGCVVVAAAGNNNGPVWYPAACSNAIAVAATDGADSRVSYSNYGKIDVSAPGDDIWSCTNWDTFSTTLPAYYSESGTSFAAPFVSGLSALLMLKYSGITPDEVRAILERSSTDIGATGYDMYTGWGRIDVLKALNRDFYAPQYTNTYNWPNPFSPGLDLYTNIVFKLASAAAVTLKIFDAAGDLVWEKELAAAQTAAGNNTVKWDGRNKAGKTAGNGTYFYTVKSAEGTGKNKIVVIH